MRRLSQDGHGLKSKRPVSVVQHYLDGKVCSHAGKLVCTDTAIRCFLQEAEYFDGLSCPNLNILYIKSSRRYLSSYFIFVPNPVEYVFYHLIIYTYKIFSNTS